MSQARKSQNLILILAVVFPLIFAIAITIVLIIAQSDTASQTASTSDTAPSMNSDGVSVYNPPKPLHNFTMPASTGETLSLSDFRGKLVLVAFGYTRCPDVCPANMLEFRQVKRFLGERADDVVFLFISVDGERDTPDFLNDYLRRYDPVFIGLSGTDTELAPLIDDYSLFYGRRENPNAPDDYMVDHTASRFLIDANGQLIRIYSYSANARTMARDITRVLVNQ